MSDRWMCPICGSTTKRLNKERMVLVCEGCGRDVRSEEETKAELDYLKNMSLARDNLSVGNWDEVKRLVKPYVKSKPADKQLYLMLLSAETKGYTDMRMADWSSLENAGEYWNKLERSKCVNQLMKEYAWRRRKEYSRMKERQFAITMILIIIVVLLSFIAMCTIVFADESIPVFVTSAVLSWIVVIWTVKKNKSERLSWSCVRVYGPRNPFYISKL